MTTRRSFFRRLVAVAIALPAAIKSRQSAKAEYAAHFMHDKELYNRNVLGHWTPILKPEQKEIFCRTDQLIVRIQRRVRDGIEKDIKDLNLGRVIS